MSFNEWTIVVTDNWTNH